MSRTSDPRSEGRGPQIAQSGMGLGVEMGQDTNIVVGSIVQVGLLSTDGVLSDKWIAQRAGGTEQRVVHEGKQVVFGADGVVQGPVVVPERSEPGQGDGVAGDFAGGDPCGRAVVLLASDGEPVVGQEGIEQADGVPGITDLRMDQGFKYVAHSGDAAQ